MPAKEGNDLLKAFYLIIANRKYIEFGTAEQTIKDRNLVIVQGKVSEID